MTRITIGTPARTIAMAGSHPFEDDYDALDTTAVAVGANQTGSRRPCTALKANSAIVRTNSSIFARQARHCLPPSRYAGIEGHRCKYSVQQCSMTAAVMGPFSADIRHNHPVLLIGEPSKTLLELSRGYGCKTLVALLSVLVSEIWVDHNSADL